VHVSFSNNFAGAQSLSREDWICIALMILGIFLFLYGANYYNNAIGWAGVLLFVVGLFGLIVLAVYNELAKRKPEVEAKVKAEAPQNP
jgi:membrane-bound ClpP family serine protease